MTVLFDNIKPGDTVHYRTPQGVTAKGKVVMNRGTHLVLNRGRGSPQVVTDKNYVKHSRGGKVVGALLSRLSVKEDSHDAEGAAERVAKTKKHKKKLHELNTGTLASYVSKAIADRKKQQGMADMAQRIHTPERAKYFVDKAAATAAKRSKGIKTAVGKIASHLPAEPLKAHADGEGSKHGGWSGMESHEVNEVSAPGKEAWIKANKARFIARYGKEKGTKILYAKAWKMANEARENEWAANQALAGQAHKPAKGHYLMRDGRRLSGPHSPEDAVKQYKSMSDSKGVKIVHVKETHQFDVTHELIFEDKYKKAVDKAINLKKKAKGNKHVDTEPKLDMVDKGTNSPMEDSGDQNVAKL